MSDGKSLCSKPSSRRSSWSFSDTTSSSVENAPVDFEVIEGGFTYLKVKWTLSINTIDNTSGSHGGTFKLDNICSCGPNLNLSWTYCQQDPPAKKGNEISLNSLIMIELYLKYVTSSISSSCTDCYRNKVATVWAEVGTGVKIHLKPFSPGQRKSREFPHEISDPDCDIIVIPCVLWIQFPTSVGELNAHRQITNLYVNQLNCDVTFSFDMVEKDEQIGGHVIILSARSSVFAAMFKNGMEESTTKKVSIKEIKPAIFKQLLYYLYSGRTPTKLSEETAQPLFIAADMYDISDLKNECVQFLLSCIKIENAINLMAWAHVQSIDTLKEAALAFVSSHIEEICHQDDWERLMKNYPDLCLMVTRRKWKRLCCYTLLDFDSLSLS